MTLITNDNNRRNDFLTDPFLNNILQLYNNNEKGGEDAKFTINGLDTGRHSNTFEINGVTFTLKDTFSLNHPYQSDLKPMSIKSMIILKRLSINTMKPLIKLIKRLVRNTTEIISR